MSEPASFIQLFETGKAHAADGRIDQALQSFQQAAVLVPHSVDLLVEYGYALKDARRLPEAQQRFLDARQITPHNLRVLNGLGLVLADMDRTDEALQTFQQALQLEPAHPMVLSNAASSLMRLQRFDEAIEIASAALDASVEFLPALIVLSLAISASARPYRHARAIDQLAATASSHATVLQGKAIALQELNRHAEALELLRMAALRDPADVVAAAMLSTAALLAGDFESGWNHFEARWDAPGGIARPYASQIDMPIWDGSTALAGRSMFVYAEQGHGDTIQFSRYCALLAKRGAEVSFAVQDVLEPVLRGLPGVTRLLTNGQPVPAFDLHCPVMSLPRAFATRLDGIPPQPRPIGALPERLAKWQALLGPKTGRRVALAWSGNPAHSNDVNRSMPLAVLAPLFELDIEFVSLQRAVAQGDEEVIALLDNLTDKRLEIEDFGDLAAIMALSDLVISVDTATAHLAGAMQRPTWICLTRRPEWRWLLERSDTPWYPSARLYRQQTAGDWQGLVAILKAALLDQATAGLH